MNWKNRLTNYNFWISIFSAMLLILQALKIEFDIAYVNEIFTAVLGLLVVIGIISDPTRTMVKSSENKAKENTESKTEIEVKEGETKKVEQENVALPIEKKDETNHNDFQSDYQNVLNQISMDIKQKFEEIRGSIQSLNSTKPAVVQEVVRQEEASSPAAAEMENPYLDVIN